MRAEVEYVAVPDALSGAVASTVKPSIKVNVPVAPAEPDDVTTEVKVMLDPAFAGLGLAVSVVVVVETAVAENSKATEGFVVATPPARS